MYKKIKKIFIILLISIFIEILFFNYGAIRSLYNGERKSVEYEVN